MASRLLPLAAAGALAGFLAIGGVSLASAQEDPTSTTTPDTTLEETPSTDGESPSTRPEGCDDDLSTDPGGAGGDAGASTAAGTDV